MMPAVPSIEQELAALAVDQHDAADGHQKVDQREDDVAPVRLDVGQPALQKNVGVIADDGVDAGGCVAEQDDACQHERNNVLAAKKRIAGLRPPRKLRPFRRAISSISRNSRSACSGVRERRSAA